MLILTCKLGNEIINCYDGTHNKEQLKKWASKKILLCPVCDKPYEYCHGKVKTPYFRHMDKAECEDLYSESETEEHLNGKRDLFEWIRKQKGVTNAVLEGWIPETKQRPDIMFEYGGEKYVIEYQCSPISTEYEERSSLYKTVGIKDIWVLGTEKYLQPNMREKYIESFSECFYDIYRKRIVVDGYLPKLFLSINKNQKDKAKRKYSHSKGTFYGFSINDFYFDEGFIFKKISDMENYVEKHYDRLENKENFLNTSNQVLENKAEKIIKIVKNKTHGKYRSKYRIIENNSDANMYLHANNLIKLYFVLNKIKEIIGENDNWIIDFYEENGNYKLIAIPNVDYDFHLYNDYKFSYEFWRKAKTYRLYIPNLNPNKIIEYYNDIELLKKKLVDAMNRNKKIFLNLDFKDKRYMEVNN